MASHRVYFNAGDQALVTIPHRRGAPVRVTAGTYQIVDTRYGIDSAEHVVVAAGTAATTDATSTVLTAKAGRGTPDDRALTLASTAGLEVGRQYILDGADGRAETVRIAAIPSVTAARTAAAVRNAFAAGSTLRGVEVRGEFPAAAAADDDNLSSDAAFMVIWSFADLPPLREMIHLERGEESLLATLDDLRELDGGLARTGDDAGDPAAALARAHKDLRVDLQLVNVSESDLLTGPIGRDAVCYRAAYHLAEHIRDDRRAARYEARYKQLLAGLTVGSKKEEVVALTKREQAATHANPATRFYGWGFGGD